MEEIDRLKIQINHMELAMKNKDNDLNKIKAELKSFQSEKANLEIKLHSKKNNLSEVNNNVQLANEQVNRNKNKLDLLRTLQVNLNKLIREYDNLPVTDLNRIELNQEIKQLEEENAELNLKIKTAAQSSVHAACTRPSDSNSSSKRLHQPLDQKPNERDEQHQQHGQQLLHRRFHIVDRVL